MRKPFASFLREHWNGNCDFCTEPSILTVPNYDDPEGEPIMLCDDCRMIVMNLIAPLSASIDDELDKDRQMIVMLETVIELIRRKQDSPA